MKPKITDIWMNELSSWIEIRVDWSNDRHHAVVLPSPYDKQRVCQALKDLSTLILHDSNLDQAAEKESKNDSNFNDKNMVFDTGSCELGLDHGICT